MNKEKFEEKLEDNLMLAIANFHEKNNIETLTAYYDSIALVNAFKLLETDLPLEMAIYLTNRGLDAQELFEEPVEGVYVYDDVFSCPAEKVVPTLHSIISNDSLYNPAEMVEDYFRENLLNNNYKEKNSIYRTYFNENISISKTVKQLNADFFEYSLKSAEKYAEMKGKYYLYLENKIVYIKNHSGHLIIEEHNLGDLINFMGNDCEANEELIDLIEMYKY